MKLYLYLPNGQGAFELTLDERTCFIMKDILEGFKDFAMTLVEKNSNFYVNY